jgi:hypothetical protein
MSRDEEIRQNREATERQMNRTRQSRQDGGFFASIGCAVAILMVVGFGTGLYEIVHNII